MDNKGEPPSYPENAYPMQPSQPYAPGQQAYPGQQPCPGQQPYPGQTHTVVITQTQPAGQARATSYLGFAIFTCLCCCWPIGIAAIIFAVRTNEENGKGNIEAARSNSKVALWCSVAALIFGSSWIIAVVALVATGNFSYYYSGYYG